MTGVDQCVLGAMFVRTRLYEPQQVRGSDQIRKRCGVHLGHHLCAQRFDRSFADADGRRKLLIEFSRNDAGKHLMRVW